MVHIRATVFKRAFVALVSTVGLATLCITPLSSASAHGGTKPQTYHLHNLKYVALGDSVAAGLGLPLATDATAEDTACGRSPQAYSSTVADGINAKLSKIRLHVSASNTACQGAVVHNLIQTQTRGPVVIQSQLDKAFAGGTPALITLTIGANDAHWADFVGACFSAADCDTPANTAVAHAYLDSMQNQLADTLGDIRGRSNHRIVPITVVTGYYNPVSVRCASTNLTAGEINWLGTVTDDLNAALQSAADDAGWFAAFAPVDFTGHDICSADPWVQRPGVPGEPAAFHPNLRGQQAMGQAVLNTLGL